MKFIILGCGSSMGVPRPDGSFGECNPKNKRNFRTRCSALLQTDTENVLIDTSPDLRIQLLNNRIRKIDKVLFSHMHADQTHGINDLRVFYLNNKKTIPVFSDKETQKYLLKNFSYCFKSNTNEYPAILKIKLINEKMLIKNNNNKVHIKTLKVKHGKVNSICYIFNKKLAYISDVSKIQDKDFKYFKNLKYIIIDCLRYKSHPSHFNLNQCTDLYKIFLPKKMILTNLHCDLDYDTLKTKLPNNMIPAHDGLTFNF